MFYAKNDNRLFDQDDLDYDEQPIKPISGGVEGASDQHTPARRYPQRRARHAAPSLTANTLRSFPVPTDMEEDLADVNLTKASMRHHASVLAQQMGGMSVDNELERAMHQVAQMFAEAGVEFATRLPFFAPMVQQLQHMEAHAALSTARAMAFLHGGFFLLQKGTGTCARFVKHALETEIGCTVPDNLCALVEAALCGDPDATPTYVALATGGPAAAAVTPRHPDAQTTHREATVEGGAGAMLRLLTTELCVSRSDVAHAATAAASDCLGTGCGSWTSGLPDTLAAITAATQHVECSEHWGPLLPEGTTQASMCPLDGRLKLQERLGCRPDVYGLWLCRAAIVMLYAGVAERQRVEALDAPYARRALDEFTQHLRSSFGQSSQLNLLFLAPGSTPMEVAATAAASTSTVPAMDILRVPTLSEGSSLALYVGQMAIMSPAMNQAQRVSFMQHCWAGYHAKRNEAAQQNLLGEVMSTREMTAQSCAYLEQLTQQQQAQQLPGVGGALLQPAAHTLPVTPTHQTGDGSLVPTNCAMPSPGPQVAAAIATAAAADAAFSAAQPPAAPCTASHPPSTSKQTPSRIPSRIPTLLPTPPPSGLAAATQTASATHTPTKPTRSKTPAKGQSSIPLWH